MSRSLFLFSAFAAHSRHALAILSNVSRCSDGPLRAIRSHSSAYLRYSSGVCIVPCPWLFSITHVANVPTTVTVPLLARSALRRTRPGKKMKFAHCHFRRGARQPRCGERRWREPITTHAMQPSASA